MTGYSSPNKRLRRSATDDETLEPSAKKEKSDGFEIPPSILVAELVKEVTEDEQTEKPLNGKISSRRGQRPENCKLLRLTKVNSEIWEIASKTTRSMDACLQKLKESLVKGLIPIERLTGTMGEVLEKCEVMPTQDELWESLSISVLLTASANHDLNMCRHDLFKVDLDDTYKAICSKKEPVGSELFGDDLTDCLKTVKESKKSCKTTHRPQKGSKTRITRDPPIQTRVVNFYSIAGGGITNRDTPRGEATISTLKKTTEACSTLPRGRNLCNRSEPHSCKSFSSFPC